MNSMSKQAPKVTDHFRQSRTDTARAPVTRGKQAASAEAAPAPPPQAAAPATVPLAEGATCAADQDTADEATLRQFDLDNRFGPCKGITRLARWERAAKLGLNPPPEVPQLVGKHGVDSLFNKDLFCEEKPF